MIPQVGDRYKRIAKGWGSTEIQVGETVIVRSVHFNSAADEYAVFFQGKAARYVLTNFRKVSSKNNKSHLPSWW